MRVNVENPVEVQIAGMLALRKALGPVGTVRFIQQFSKGAGDYTKERHEQPEPSIDEVIAGLEAIEASR